MVAGRNTRTRVVADLTAWAHTAGPIGNHLLDLADGHGPLPPSMAVRPVPGVVAADFIGPDQAVAALLDWVETLEASSIEHGRGSRLGGGFICVVTEEPGPDDSIVPGPIDLASNMVLAMTGPDEVAITEAAVVGAGAVPSGGYDLVLSDLCCPLNGEYLYRLDHSRQPGFVHRSTLAWARRAIASHAPSMEAWDDPSGIRRLARPAGATRLMVVSAQSRDLARAAAAEWALHCHSRGTLILYGFWDESERRSPLDVAVDSLALGFDPESGAHVPPWSESTGRAGRDVGLDDLGRVRFTPRTASIVEHLAELGPCLVVLDGVPVDDARTQTLFEVVINLAFRNDIDFLLVTEMSPERQPLPIVQQHFLSLDVAPGSPRFGRVPLVAEGCEPEPESAATDPDVGVAEVEVLELPRPRGRGTEWRSADRFGRE